MVRFVHDAWFGTLEVGQRHRQHLFRRRIKVDQRAEKVIPVTDDGERGAGDNRRYR